MAFKSSDAGGHQERPRRFARGFGFEEVSRSTTKIADALLQFDNEIFWLPQVLNLEVFGLAGAGMYTVRPSCHSGPSRKKARRKSFQRCLAKDFAAPSG